MSTLNMEKRSPPSLSEESMIAIEQTTEVFDQDLRRLLADLGLPILSTKSNQKVSGFVNRMREHNTQAVIGMRNLIRSVMRSNEQRHSDQIRRLEKRINSLEEKVIVTRSLVENVQRDLNGVIDYLDITPATDADADADTSEKPVNRDAASASISNVVPFRRPNQT